MYERVVRPALFRLSAQRAHRLTHPILRNGTVCRLLAGEVESDPRLSVSVGSLELPGPVGLAPGFDKYGELTRGLSRLGFDYLVPGTVMAEPEADIRGTSILRLPRERALINCMGRPSKGFEHSARELERGASAVPLVISIGADSIEAFSRCHARIEPLAHAVELNVQCHNEEPGAFEEPEVFEELIASLVVQRRKPLFLRVNAARNGAERDKRLEMASRAFELGVEGFSAVGTCVVRSDARLVTGRGVVTGEPLREHTLRAIRDLWDVTGGRAIIRARGGISTGEDAFRAVAAGAACVEVYTAFVYRGWSVAREIKHELLATMDRQSVESLASLRGAERQLSPGSPVVAANPSAHR
jgi:dihydroorotate dehydrogenase